MKNLIAHRWGYGNHRQKKKNRMTVREKITFRAQNSGVFVNLPAPELDDREWTVELKKRMDHARDVLVEFRELIRNGQKLPDLEARKVEEARHKIKLFMDTLDDIGVDPDKPWWERVGHEDGSKDTQDTADGQ